MSLIYKYIRQIWPSMVFLILITFLATLVTTMRPLAAAGVINLTLDQIGYSDTSQEVDSPTEANIFDLNQIGSIITDVFFTSFDFSGGILEAIPYFVLLLLLLSFLAGFVKYTGHILNALARSKIMSRLRQDLSYSLLELDISFFNERKSGELISRVITDAQAVGQGVVSVTHRILHSFLLIVVYFVFLVNTSVTLTGIIILIILIHYLITTLLKNPIKKFEILNLEAMAGLTASLQEVFSNIRLIQSNLSSVFSTKNLDNNIKKSSNAYFKTQLVGSLEPETRYVLDGLAEGIILFVAITQLFSGEINIEGFLLYIYVSRLMLGPINEFSSYFVWLQRIFASSERIKEYFALESEIKDGTKIITDFDQRISFEKVSFAYSKEPFLKKIDLEIKKNEVIAIVGKSGAGKSTIVDLILRFYDPNSGKILLDGKDIKKFTLESYRSLFGVVFQEVALINDTIENNIRYGRELDKNQIIKASKLSNIHDFIISLPEGYKTLVGDRGVKLSGGQRQRLSIARALADNPKILIFDEATSSLDSESERIVQNGIENALIDRTAIIIAHRFSTIKNADRIVVIDQGEIEAIGKYDTLLETSFIFKMLVEQHQ